ncbi:MAG: adenylosuccinate synthase [Fibrobacterales bacterium]
MPNRVIIGSQWGDEGKAKVVDFLTFEADIIVRFQGGANAGHTVLVGDQEFVFHLIPSGIMHEDKVCVIGNGVVLDPKQMLIELEDIKQKGIKPDGRFKIADNAHVVLPFHTKLDQLKEIAAGKNAIGTTGRGIGPCYSDKVNRLGLRVGELLDKEGLAEKINAIADVKNEQFKILYNAEPLDPAAIVEEYYDYGQQLKAFICDTSTYLNQEWKKGGQIIFEGAQGTILDVDHGTYPYVTSSNTVSGSACCGSGIGPTAIDQVIGVVKAYTTRVGNGPFPTELNDDNGQRLGDIGHEFGATTGRQRRCGWFDAPVVRKAAQINGLTHLAITKLDVLDTFDTIKICTDYELDGETLTVMPNQLTKVSMANPVYIELEGWNSDTTDCKTWDELPENAKKYLETLSKLIDVKIGMVSVGPRRDQSITVDLQ